MGWPARLWLVRHGESEGNLADRRAHEEGLGTVDVADRDPDVALTALGERQARALGERLAALGGDGPQVVVSSPYVRARRTAELAVAAAGLDVPVLLDERLRERDLGVLDGLTGRGIRERLPDEAERRARLGKLYYRPPGGESWVDVALRVRAVLTDLRREHADRRLLVTTHQAVVMVFRYVLEGLTEDEVLAVDRRVQVANTAVTAYEGDGDRVRLLAFNDADHLGDVGEDVTAEPGTEARAHAGA
ncbi:histidine phosphatase family protein [Vallicoccus soli]|uniref:phosphoglycerate mutase (2,3-diphosphoglycerate-dependent) n=1 Tax=Vallicoccus soli TaxID=2339232 RepID=A0A3A3ZKU3_9ACTN|nr:histidine phosphatase family protein [Vallicoccus soli]